MRLYIHHALFDAASLQLLMHDFEVAIHHEDMGSPTSIDPVLKFMLRAAGDHAGESEEFWRRMLEHAR